MKFIVVCICNLAAVVFLVTNKRISCKL